MELGNHMQALVVGFLLSFTFELLCAALRYVRRFLWQDKRSVPHSGEIFEFGYKCGRMLWQKDKLIVIGCFGLVSNDQMRCGAL